MSADGAPPARLFFYFLGRATFGYDGWLVDGLGDTFGGKRRRRSPLPVPRAAAVASRPPPGAWRARPPRRTPSVARPPTASPPPPRRVRVTPCAGGAWPPRLPLAPATPPAAASAARVGPPAPDQVPDGGAERATAVDGGRRGDGAVAPRREGGLTRGGDRPPATAAGVAAAAPAASVTARAAAGRRGRPRVGQRRCRRLRTVARTARMAVREQGQDEGTAWVADAARTTRLLVGAAARSRVARRPGAPETAYACAACGLANL